MQTATLTPLTVITAAAAVIHARGYYQPQTRPWEPAVPTAMDVRTIVYGWQRSAHHLSAAAVRRAVAATTDQPAAVLTWCTTPPATPNDYRTTLDQLARAGHVHEQDIPLLCSAVHQWAADQAKATRRRQAAGDAANSRHQGTPGERVTRTVTVVTVTNPVPNHRHPASRDRRFVRLRDEHGHVYVWTTTTNNPPTQNTTVTITGTIAKHDTYRDTAQTHLSRCRWTPTT